MSWAGRRVLMLQGPHGPFFAELATALRAQGAEVWRVGINAGDAAEWPGPGFLKIDAAPHDRDLALAQAMTQHQITDLILYGDRRAFHAQAVQTARALGIRCHILEEGYIRPHWITYERQGSNQRSPAATWPLDSLSPLAACTEPRPAARWGALKSHIAYGVLYHLRLLLGARRYPRYRSHRSAPVIVEAARSFGAALTLPLAMAWRTLAQTRVLRQGGPLFVVLMQLEHDSALADSGITHRALLDQILAAFATHAAPEARLIVKMHPLEARRLHLARLTAARAHRHGLAARVVALPGGRLAPLLDRATAALTVNSTAGQQVLWRGLPLYAFGPSVYAHDALLPERDLGRFLRAPTAAPPEVYARFRAFLFQTSQLPGSFYAPRGRAAAIAALLPKLLADCDPYDHVAAEAVTADRDTLINPSASGQVAV